MDFKAITQLGRFKDITTTLVKYGFGDVVERLDFPGKKLLKKIQPVDAELNTWERIRLSMEELGPTFTKLGQIISLRPDLLPPELIKELEKLQDEVAPVPYSEIKEILAANLSKPFDHVFSYFEEKPLAAASLAQVHRAMLQEDKQVVAVKVQRSGVRQVTETDLSILEAIVGYLDGRLEIAKTWDFEGLLQEFKKGLSQELDFTYEARNIRIVRGNFEARPEVYIPRLYEKYCTDSVLTMELVQGTKLKDYPAGNAADRKLLAQHGLRATVQQILEDGFFHADPHPGNVLIRENNVLCILDWGIVGRLDQESRFQLVDLIMAIVDKDSQAVLDTLVEITGERTADVDAKSLQRAILDLLDSYYSIPLENLNLGQLMMEFNGLLCEHNLRVPADLALMIKALVTSEGTARQLYPELNVVEEAEPLVKKLATERWKPEVMWRRMRRIFSHLFTMQKNLPKRLDHIFRKIERGELSIPLEHENFEGLQHSFQHAANRLTLGIITASMIIGSSLIITTGIKPLLFGYPALGILGYLFSAVFGVWLLISIMRS
jgi:ubiquinone biosynthesis protein